MKNRHIRRSRKSQKKRQHRQRLPNPVQSGRLNGADGCTVRNLSPIKVGPISAASVAKDSNFSQTEIDMNEAIF